MTHDTINACRALRAVGDILPPGASIMPQTLLWGHAAIEAEITPRRTVRVWAKAAVAFHRAAGTRLSERCEAAARQLETA